MKNALKFETQVGPDHLVKLPDEVPVGPAEIIVLVEEASAFPGALEDFEPMVPTRSFQLSEVVLAGRD
jgi:hypothetical protein